MTVTFKSLPVRASAALGWSVHRGPRCRFRTFSARGGVLVTVLPHEDAPALRAEDRYYKDLDGRRWYAFDYWYAATDDLGSLSWLLKPRDRGRGRTRTEDIELVRGLQLWALDHVEYLESADGERRLISHINAPALLDDARERLAKACARYNLVWMQRPPPASWSHPERAMITITPGAPRVEPS